MKIKSKISIVIFTLLAGGIIVYSFYNVPPHQFKEGQCSFCHINYEPPFSFRDNISTLCNYCHRKRNVLSHLVSVKPSMQIPGEFHLDSNGEMTCTTCHNIHMNNTNPATGERTFLLRGELRGKEFCDICHINTLGVVEEGKLPSHADILETAHLGYYTSENRSIDGVSLYCLSCHEGSAASHVSVSTKAVSPIGESHNIGANYQKAYRKNKELRPIKSLSTEIKLFEGKVGCTSCHNPFNLARHKLSITNEESKLCFECHLM